MCPNNAFIVYVSGRFWFEAPAGCAPQSVLAQAVRCTRKCPSVGCTSGEGTAGSRDSSLWSFGSQSQMVFQGGCANSRSHQQADGFLHVVCVVEPVRKHIFQAAHSHILVHTDRAQCVPGRVPGRAPAAASGHAENEVSLHTPHSLLRVTGPGLSEGWGTA